MPLTAGNVYNSDDGGNLMVGRKKEIEELERIYKSDKAELVAIYGRRRIGKTYLVNQLFEDRLSFAHAGLSPIEQKDMTPKERLNDQLKNFRNSLIAAGAEGVPNFDNWLDGFLQLELFLQNKYGNKRMVVFLDELPWLDTPGSKFVTAFEAFWNSWAVRKNIMVIICGSSTSWMLNKVINDKNGLYGRVGYEIPLSPFTLQETEEFFKNKGIELSRYDIARIYMVVGGVPFYLNYYEKGKSLAENVDLLFFDKNAKLKYEFNRLFKAVFTFPEHAEKVVRALANVGKGLTREEIIKQTSISDGGTFSSVMGALMASDFVSSYIPFGSGKRNVCYKLIDPFCLFYLRFVENAPSSENGYWKGKATSQAVISWQGLAFENIVFTHANEILAKLKVAGVRYERFSWFYKGNEEIRGAQADMIIVRADNIVNLIEAKFYGDDFIQTKQESESLRHKISALSPLLKKRSTISPILVTTFGLKEGEHSLDYDNVVVLDDLFRAD